MALKFSGSAPFKDTSQTAAANADGDAIAALRDDSGGGYHLTQGTSGARPTYKTNIFNSAKPAFRFDGGDYLVNSTLGGQLTGDFTVGLIVQGTDKSIDSMVLSFGELADGKRRAVWIQSSNGYVNFSGYNQGNITSTKNVKDGNPNRIVITKSGTTITIRVNGTQVATGTSSLNSFTGTNFALGGNFDGSEKYIGDVGPLVVIHNTALTGTDLTDLEASLLAAITAAPDLTPTITTASVPAGTVGTAYDQTLAVSSGDGTITWSKQSGTLPPGISFNTATHKFEGTPTTAGTYSGIVIRATDADGDYDEETYSIVIAPADTNPVITTTTLPSGTVGTAYNQTLARMGGESPIMWAIVSGALPAGLSLNSATGAITGTPTTAETAYFIARVTDNDSDTDDQNLQIIIAAVDTNPTITTPSFLPNGVVSGEYHQTLTRTGGEAPFTWSVASGTLPDGLSLNASTGIISGIPTVPGTFYFTVRVTDSDGDSDDQATQIFVGAESVLDQNFERLELSKFLNITQLELEMPVLTADFGDGYGAGVLSGKASGLRYWSISADVLPDLEEYSVSYIYDGASELDSRFNYLWEFFRRHLALGNKPFYFVDPRTNRKFLASFAERRISFESLTAKLYRGGVQIKQRRVKVTGITFRDEDGSIE